MNPMFPKTKSIPTGHKLRAIAFALLAKREHSKYDLTQKLQHYGAHPEEIEQLVNELEHAHYQSDERMAGMLVRSQVRQGRGLQRVKQSLKKHDIAPELAQTALEDIDWLQEALQLKIKKFGTDIATEPKQKAKQIRFLQYRGFSMDIIMKVIKYREDDE
jgi:regulatory protein